MAAKSGDVVSVHYTGTLDDGTVFDSSVTRGEPISFKIGEGKVIKGFDAGITGMAVGEKKKIRIVAEEAYGAHRPELMQQVPRDKLPQDQEPKVGMMLGVRAPDGMQFPATITAVTADSVTLDLNHPMAGKALNFELELVKIE